MKTLQLIVMSIIIISCTSNETIEKNFHEELNNSKDYILYNQNVKLKKKDFLKYGDFSYYIGVSTKMDKNNSNLNFQVYFSKNESYISKEIEDELLIKNLYLANSAFTIFQIESLREQKKLERIRFRTKNIDDLMNITEKINEKAWVRIDSLKQALEINFDTLKTNRILFSELKKI